MVGDTFRSLARYERDASTSLAPHLLRMFYIVKTSEEAGPIDISPPGQLSGRSRTRALSADVSHKNFAYIDSCCSRISTEVHSA